MKSLAFGAIFILVGAIAAYPAALVAENEKRPTRAECIGGAELLWAEKENKLARVTVLNQIADVYPLTLHYPRVGSSIHHESNRIYIAFTKGCAIKDQMMNQIMMIYQKNIPGFPHYRIIEGPIEPSPQTIQVYGEHWSDGDMPSGLMD